MAGAFNKIKRNILSILFLLTLTTQLCSAQGEEEVSAFPYRDLNANPAFSLNDTTLSKIDLNKELSDQFVPIDSLIKVAIQNSPTIQAQDALIDASKDQIKFARREWQNGISGTFSQSMGNQSLFYDSNQEVNTVQSSSLQTGYRLGLNVSVPLFLLFGRTSRINVYEHEREVREKTGEKIKLDVSRQVISEYNEMLSAHRILLLSTRSRGTTRLLQEMADKQFAQGDITIADYSSVAAIASKAEQDYEIARSNFYNKYLSLEKLLGVRLDTLVRKK